MGGEQRAIGIRWRLATWSRKPFRRDLARVADGRSRTDARTPCLKAEQETIDDVLVDPRRSRSPGGKLAEPAELTNVDLGRSGIVANELPRRREGQETHARQSDPLARAAGGGVSDAVARRRGAGGGGSGAHHQPVAAARARRRGARHGRAPGPAEASDRTARRSDGPTLSRPDSGAHRQPGDRARLEAGDLYEILHWSSRNQRWAPFGPFGRTALPVEQAVPVEQAARLVAEASIFWAAV